MAALASAIACSAKDKSQDTSANKTAAPGAPGAAAGGAQPAAGAAAGTTDTSGMVTVHAKDFSFDAPDRIPGGTTAFRLVNDGPGLHHLQIIRIDSGKTITDLTNAMKKPGPLPVWAVLVGGPNAPDPHSESNATLDLAPGNYALMCLVDMPGGVPHFTKGMVRPLLVTQRKIPAKPMPTADILVTLRDYQFEVNGRLAPGRHTFSVRTEGPQAHELELIKLAPGKTAKDFGEWMQKMQGPPPGSAMGGVAAESPNATDYFTADLTPGDYVLICFVPDAKDGKPHFQHGMMQTITVPGSAAATGPKA
jgi:hypothetical protein